MNAGAIHVKRDISADCVARSVRLRSDDCQEVCFAFENVDGSPMYPSGWNFLNR